MSAVEKYYPIINDFVKSQGLSITIVLLLAAWFGYDNYQYRNKLEKEYIKLQAEVKDCNTRILILYEKDRADMMEIIDRNTEMLDRIERRLDE